MQTVTSAVENSMEFSQKIKNGISFDPVIPLLGLYTKNPETPIQKNLCTPMFIAALFTITKCWKQPKCPLVDELINNHGNLHNLILAERKKEFLPFVTDSMGGTRDYYA